jgi:glutaconate CoA-transferase subunit A
LNTKTSPSPRSQRSGKVTSLEDAAALVKDGCRLAIGGFAIYQRPMAFVRELVRQRRRDLTIVGVTNSMDTDILIGAGAVSRLETSYVGFEKYGLAKNFRRACEKDGMDVVDYPELLSWDRFRASQENLAFWPAAGLGGTDVVNLNSDIKPFDCPISGRPLHALPAAAPDVVVLHALAADMYGNVIVPSYRNLPQSLDLTLARCCDTVIVTTERIVSENFLKRHAHLVEIPSVRVSAVCVTPFGAHPTSMLGRYQDDESHWDTYVEASQSPEAFSRYLDEFVHGPQNHDAYLDKIGGAHLASLYQVDTQK